jgi:cysteine-rich repeat protein
MRNTWVTILSVALSGACSSSTVPQSGSESDGTTTEASGTSGADTDTTDDDMGATPDVGTGGADDCGDGQIDEGEQCDLGLGNADNGACTSQCKLAQCGDGLIQLGQEACDDGNQLDDDQCTTLCQIPSCDDGIRSGQESDVDCGGNCIPCAVGNTCKVASDCATWACVAGMCGYADSCKQLHDLAPLAPSNRYMIDVDGAAENQPFEVWCEMERAGGGWTLVVVSSDDGQDTWTWANRAWLGTDPTTVGSLDFINEDFKSRGYNEMGFRDLLFVHAPSDVWAEYDDVSGGSTDLGHFVAAIPVPVCDLELADNGYPLSDGTLILGGGSEGALCDTDLYFNLGDHEGGLSTCVMVSVGDATFGPVWNAGWNHGCNFDDPCSTSLGPDSFAGWETVESSYRGFGTVLGLDTAPPATAQNFTSVLIR